MIVLLILAGVSLPGLLLIGYIVFSLARWMAGGMRA